MPKVRNFTIILPRIKKQRRGDKKHAKRYHPNSEVIVAKNFRNAIWQITGRLRSGDRIGTIWRMSEQTADGQFWDGSKWADPGEVRQTLWTDVLFKRRIRRLRESLRPDSRIVFETCYGNENTQRVIAGILGVPNAEYTPRFTWTRDDGMITIGVGGKDLHSRQVIEDTEVWKKIRVKPQPMTPPAPKWRRKKSAPIQIQGRGRTSIQRRTTPGSNMVLAGGAMQRRRIHAGITVASANSRQPRSLTIIRDRQGRLGRQARQRALQLTATKPRGLKARSSGTTQTRAQKVWRYDDPSSFRRKPGVGMRRSRIGSRLGQGPGMDQIIQGIRQRFEPRRKSLPWVKVYQGRRLVDAWPQTQDGIIRRRSGIARSPGPFFGIRRG